MKLKAEVKVLTLKRKGDAALKQCNFVEAIASYSGAIKLDPNNPLLFLYRSTAYCLTYELEHALADAEKTVALRPEWAKGYSRLGSALYSLERFEEAAEAYTNGLRYDPTNVQMEECLEDVKEQITCINKSSTAGNWLSSFQEADVFAQFLVQNNRNYLRRKDLPTPGVPTGSNTSESQINQINFMSSGKVDKNNATNDVEFKSSTTLKLSVDLQSKVNRRTLSNNSSTANKSETVNVDAAKNFLITTEVAVSLKRHCITDTENMVNESLSKTSITAVTSQKLKPVELLRGNGIHESATDFNKVKNIDATAYSSNKSQSNTELKEAQDKVTKEDMEVCERAGSNVGNDSSDLKRFPPKRVGFSATNSPGPLEQSDVTQPNTKLRQTSNEVNVSQSQTELNQINDKMPQEGIKIVKECNVLSYNIQNELIPSNSRFNELNPSIHPSEHRKVSQPQARVENTYDGAEERMEECERAESNVENDSSTLKRSAPKRVRFSDLNSPITPLEQSDIPQSNTELNQMYDKIPTEEIVKESGGRPDTIIQSEPIPSTSRFSEQHCNVSQPRAIFENACNDEAEGSIEAYRRKLPNPLNNILTRRRTVFNQEDIPPWRSSHPEPPSILLKILIPNHLAGNVFGHGGKKFVRIQVQSNVKAAMSQRDVYFPGQKISLIHFNSVEKRK